MADDVILVLLSLRCGHAATLQGVLLLLLLLLLCSVCQKESLQAECCMVQASVASHLLALMRREADAPVIQGEVAPVNHFLTCDLEYVLLMLPWPPTHHVSSAGPTHWPHHSGMHLLCWPRHSSGSLTRLTAVDHTLFGL